MLRLSRFVTPTKTWIIELCISLKQWAAVIIVFGPIIVPPQNGWLKPPIVMPISFRPN